MGQTTVIFGTKAAPKKPGLVAYAQPQTDTGVLYVQGLLGTFDETLSQNKKNQGYSWEFNPL